MLALGKEVCYQKALVPSNFFLNHYIITGL